MASRMYWNVPMVVMVIIWSCLWSFSLGKASWSSQRKISLRNSAAQLCDEVQQLKQGSCLAAGKTVQEQCSYCGSIIQLYQFYLTSDICGTTILTKFLKWQLSFHLFWVWSWHKMQNPDGHHHRWNCFDHPLVSLLLWLKILGGFINKRQFSQSLYIRNTESKMRSKTVLSMCWTCRIIAYSACQHFGFFLLYYCYWQFDFLSLFYNLNELLARTLINSKSHMSKFCCRHGSHQPPGPSVF